MSKPAPKSAPVALLSTPKVYLYILLAVLQNFLAGGLFFGWASLSYTLFTSSDGCGMTPSQVSTIFSGGSFVNFMSPLLLGVLLDTSGPRITSFMSLFIVSAGLVTFSLSTSFVGYLVSTMLISFGGPGVQNSLIHLGNVRPDQRSLLTSFITGAFSLSFAVFAGFEKVWEKGYNYETIFGVYGLLIFATSLVSLVVWPDTSYDSKGRLAKPAPEPEKSKDPTENTPLTDKSAQIKHYTNPRRSPSPPPSALRGVGQNHSFQPSRAPLNSYLRPNPKGVMSTHPSFVLSTVAFATGQLDNLNVKDQPFSYQVRSLSYLRIVLFFGLLSYVANFGVGSVGLMLSDFKAEHLNTLTTEFSVISALGVLGMPVCGWLLDKHGEAFTAVVTSCLGIGYCVLFLNEMFITSFWFYSMFRSFLFCYFFANLPVVMGFKYFGILAGIAFAVSGVVQLSIKFVVEWGQGDCHEKSTEDCDQGRWGTVLLIQAIACALAAMLPVWEKLEQKKKAKELEGVFGTPKTLRRDFHRLSPTREREEEEDEDILGF